MSATHAVTRRRRRQVEKLVRSVGVGLRAEHTGHHELRLRVALAEHRHERDRAADAHRAGGLPERVDRRGVHCGREPRRGRRGVPATRVLDLRHSRRRAVGHVGSQSFDHLARCGFRVGGRGQAHGQLRGREGPQHVAGVHRQRRTGKAGHRQRGAPRLGQDHLATILGHRVRRTGEGVLLRDVEQRGNPLRLLDALGGHVDLHLGHQHATRRLVFDARQQRSQDAERGRDHAARAGVHAFGQHVDAQVELHQPAQRRARPQSVVVSARRVEAHHQFDVTEPVRERLDVRGQIRAATFLRRLDEDDAARVALPAGAHGLDGGERGERGVAVVGAAASVETVTLDPWFPRAEAVVPPRHLRLLVEVAVEQHGSGRRGVRGRYVTHDHGRAPRQPVDRQGQAFDASGGEPVADELDSAFHVSVGFPVRIECRRLVGNADVVLQDRHDPAPGVVNKRVAHSA